MSAPQSGSDHQLHRLLNYLQLWMSELRKDPTRPQAGGLAHPRQHFLTFERKRTAVLSTILRIELSLDEPALDQPIDHYSHRGRCNAEIAGQVRHPKPWPTLFWIAPSERHEHLELGHRHVYVQKRIGLHWSERTKHLPLELENVLDQARVGFN
jgi:hypothetical protein